MTVKFEDFSKLELVVGLVENAEPLAGANKLLKLTVDIGTEKRQLLAGIAQWYRPEQLVGKRIVVLANLEPKLIRGMQSQGMLLAAESEDSGDVSLLTVDKDMPPGTKVR